jgi:hypothetical protein
MSEVSNGPPPVEDNVLTRIGPRGALPTGDMTVAARTPMAAAEPAYG